MKKTVFTFLLIVTCFLLNACTNEKNNKVSEQCTPTLPDLQFISFDQFFECLKTEGEVVNEFSDVNRIYRN